MTENQKTIVLVGIMGSGKTLAGRALSQLLGLPFADSDSAVEEAAGCTVAELFEGRGEPEFRRYERDIMAHLLDGDVKVLASGGGGFIQDIIRKNIKEKAISVWLKPNFNVLVERNKRHGHRPLLKGQNVESRLQELIDVRYPVYAQADITIMTDGQTPEETARQIKLEIDRLLRREGNNAAYV